MPRRFVRAFFGALSISCALLASQACVVAAPLEELPIERWAKLGEADRYQLNVAEKCFKENNWKAAASEYEKFLSLYEKSEGAPFAQLKWSMCQSNLRKQNTAIKDGYQSVLDYWPESPEASSAAYLIGKSYKEMGEIRSAKKSYKLLLDEYPDSFPAILAKIDLADVARIEGEEPLRISLLKEIVFDVKRTPESGPTCAEVSHQLALILFSQGDFPGGLKSLETSHQGGDLGNQIQYQVRVANSGLMQKEETKARAGKNADAASAMLRTLLPSTIESPEQKNSFRTVQCWVADVQSSVWNREETLRAIDDYIAKVGPDDEMLGRKAGYLKQFNQRDEARAVFAQLKNLAEGQHQIAHSYREERRFDKAIPIYQALMSTDAQNSGKWIWELAHCYRDAGQYKEAIAAYQQCDAFPEDSKCMADCYRHLGQFKEALGMYQQVLAGHEDSAPWAMLEIARTYEQAGQKEPAIKAFQQVCKRYPKSGEASQAHVHLNETYKLNITLGGAVDE